MSTKKELQSISEGSRDIYYEDCESVELVALRDEDIGFVGFYGKYKENSQNEIVFIFGNHSSRREALKPLCTIIATKIHDIKTGKNATPQQQAHNPLLGSSSSVADEILKYKNLLDMGAITNEEFEAKKKQLLGL